MDFKPNYVPKKRKWSYKIVVPFIVFLLLLSYFSYRLISDNTKDESLQYTACGLDVHKTKKLLSATNASFVDRKTREVGDYSVFGETLKFYQNEYTTTQDDPLIGQVLYITNVCSSDKISQSLISNNELDSGINFSKLEDGLYTIEILGDIDNYVLVAHEDLEREFYGINRSGNLKKAKLKATQSFYEEVNNLDARYLLLEVSTIKEHEEYDIILDPSAGNFDGLGGYNYGHNFNEVYEADLMYDLAKGVEAILKDHDLRVLVTRDAVNPISYFGEDSRMKKAYESKAKYYIHMRVESSGSQMDRGLLALYSNFTSNRLAQSLVQNIVQESGFQTSPYTDRVNIPGVYQTNTFKDLDNDDFIRESGGRYTGAGIIEPFNDSMQFASDFDHGMLSVNMLYGYLTHRDDFNMWENNPDAIILGTAKGILNYLGIEYKGD